MEPSNQSNGNPFIFRILDSLGISHQTAPVNHTHSQSEVNGLVSELADKAEKVHDHKRIIYTVGNQTALVQVSKDSSDNVQIELAIYDAAEVEYERKAVLNWANMANAQRAFATPDSAPTANSTNLVTSGGVKTALDGKQNTLTFDTAPTASSTNPVTSGGVKTALDSKQNTLTFDNTPTQNSNNPVKSSGIFLALEDKANKSAVVPEYISYDGTQLDLDSFIGDSQGICRLCVQNASGAEVTFADLFFSGDGLPVHQNINGSAKVQDSYYAIATIYKLDVSEHEHDVCYFVELNGIFGTGN